MAISGKKLKTSNVFSLFIVCLTVRIKIDQL